MRTNINFSKKPSHSQIILASIFVGLFACSSPERAAKILGKRATQKVAQLCIPNSVNSEVCLPDFKQLINPPSLSETLSDKTEIISTW